MSTSTDASDLARELHVWLEEHWNPELTLREWWRRLAESGWAYPHFPEKWYGKGLPVDIAGGLSLVIRDFPAVPAPVGFGPNMAARTLLDHGTDDQIRRHLPGIVAGADYYCQLFSEPNAGSDLAGLQCRAERNGDSWVVNGQKVWTSSAHLANKGMLLARTDAGVPKHAGISYFFIDLLQPGVNIRPLREMTGRSFFNEVFLTDARVASTDLIGGEGRGWAVANTTLAYERGRGSTGGVAPWASAGPQVGDLDRPAGDFVAPRGVEAAMPHPQTSTRLSELAVRLGRNHEPVIRQNLARLYTLERVAAITGLRAAAIAAAGGEMGGVANLTKMAANHIIRLSSSVTFAMLREFALLYGYAPTTAAVVEGQSGLEGLAEILESAIFASAPPIFGGSDQIQRNVVGERVLGLPREPSENRNAAFEDLAANRSEPRP